MYCIVFVLYCMYCMYFVINFFNNIFCIFFNTNIAQRIKNLE